MCGAWRSKRRAHFCGTRSDASMSSASVAVMVAFRAKGLHPVIRRTPRPSSRPGRGSRSDSDRATRELLVGAGAAGPLDEPGTVGCRRVRHVETLAAVPGDQAVVAVALVLERPLLVGAAAAPVLQDGRAVGRRRVRDVEALAAV